MQLLRATIAGLAGLCTLHQAAATPTPVEVRQTATVTDLTIFSPPSNAGWVDPRVLYARAVHLRSSGDLLATWENYSPEPPQVHFPIYRSSDGGVSWREIGRVRDTVNDWGLRYQPFLYELPSRIGRFPAGTLLLAGNSIPTDLSKTKIDIYASTDGGVNWSFVSSVASGGEARPNNGLTPVWEPFLMVYNNQLICYYADQRDKRFGQKLSHQTTRDLLTWSNPVDDVNDTSNFQARPGMPVVAALPNGEYIFVYEVCGTDGCRVHYRMTRDPLNVLSARGHTLVSDKGQRPVSSPYVVWSSVGGPDGTIVVSSGRDQIFVNRRLGDPAAWTEHEVPQPRAYSRGLTLFNNDDNKLLLIGAGWLPPSSTNRVSVSVIDLKATIGA
ncbi:hypothetical protein DL766_006448 [Monosporascus sp. MC13-8B]|uniref:Sialidase domain-containing protein n=1 Tax=Monosporascus cannonballus TaxID=155416 RepID=A0ABY0H2Z0_9PEZI|nr:hypothetical protein DL763_010575 [Monosporascus cannonballus]RYO80993.1 hypothetical protein DL762_007363 [Monosporascus cannonballus]RYP27338.1 hypothetical protein DL766_006448 [Monosporascus sp. MC13-8B]